METKSEYYVHVSDVGNFREGPDGKKEKITTSNDCTKYDPNINLYLSLKEYLKDKIWEKGIDLKEVVKWTASLVDKLLEPINSNWIKNLKELENLLVKSYWAWKKHIFTDENWVERAIRFSTSFNFPWTTFLRLKDNVNIEWWVTEKATHNLSDKTNLICTDSVSWSSIPAAPTGWYFKNQDWEESEKHDGFWLLWKIQELRPMDDKFDKELYERIMNLPVEITFKWFAYEHNSDETVIMPTFTIEWKKIEEEIKKFSQDLPESSIGIPTSKKYLADL